MPEDAPVSTDRGDVWTRRNRGNSVLAPKGRGRCRSSPWSRSCWPPRSRPAPPRRRPRPGCRWRGATRPVIVRANTWFVRDSLTGGVADHTFTYGQAGDVPLLGDWDGDGEATPGVVRGSSWLLRNNLDGGPTSASPTVSPATTRWSATGTATAPPPSASSGAAPGICVTATRPARPTSPSATASAATSASPAPAPSPGAAAARPARRPQGDRAQHGGHHPERGRPDLRRRRQRRRRASILSTLDADALPGIIAELRRRGYGFVTIYDSI
jgi:hypothetical protein